MTDKIKVFFCWKITADYLNMKVVNSSYESTEETKKVIEKWREKVLDFAEKKWHKIFNWALLRFEGFNYEQNIAYLKISKWIFYKEVVWLRNNKLSKYLNVSETNNPNAFSVINIVISSDNKLILWWRKDWDWDHSFEISWWFLRWYETESIFDSSVNRLKDDLNIEQNLISHHYLVSIYDYKEILETTWLFLIKLNITEKELKQINWHYEKHLEINNERNSINKILKANLKFHEPTRQALYYYIENFTKLNEYVK